MLAGIYSMMNDDINVMQKIVFANPRLKVLVMEDVCTLRGRWGFVSNFFLLIDCHHFCIRRGKIVPDDLHAIPCGLRFRLRVGGGGWVLHGIHYFTPPGPFMSSELANDSLIEWACVKITKTKRQ